MFNKTINIILFSAIFLFAIALNAQKPQQKISQKNFYSNRLATLSTFTETYNNSDSLKLNLYYSLPIENYLLKQNEKGYYQTISRLEVTFSDKDGVVKFYKIIQDTIILQLSVESKSKTTLKNGYVEIIFPKNEMEIKIRVTDINSKKSETVEANHLLIDSTTKAKVSLLFLSVKGNENIPNILNNSLEYSPFSKKILLSFPYSEYDNLSYKINYKKSEEQPSIFFKEISGKVKTLDINNITVTKDYSVLLERESQAAAGNYYSANFISMIELPDNPFLPGEYTLEIFNNNKKIIANPIKVVWANQPFSLNNIDFVLQASSFFLNEKEIDEVRSANRKNQFVKLYDVWKKFDSSPQNNFNEKLFEFYNRVDYAFLNYSTFAEKNGALTDRGKVYILNGAPTQIQEVFKMKKLNEIWTYSNLIKQFTFESIEPGVFKLVEVKE